MKKELIARELVRIAKCLTSAVTREEAKNISSAVMDLADPSESFEKMKAYIKKNPFLTIENIKAVEGSGFVNTIDKWIEDIVSQGMDCIAKTSGWDILASLEPRKAAKVLEATKIYSSGDRDARMLLGDIGTDILTSATMEGFYGRVSDIARFVEAQEEVQEDE